MEKLVNEKIRQNAPVKAYELPYEEVQKKAEIKQFFGDKYDSIVRVVDIDFSKELCGGTHTHHLGTLGLFRILKESSIAAGVRRIEAATGSFAEAFMYHNEEMALAAATLLKTPLNKLEERTAALLEENKELVMQVKTFKRTSLLQLAEHLKHKVITTASIPLIAQVVDLSPEEVSLLAEELMNKLGSLVLILATQAEGRCQLFVRVSPDLVKKGIQAHLIVKEIAPSIGGTGGGKPDSAQAGGKSPEHLGLAFDKAQKFLETLC